VQAVEVFLSSNLNLPLGPVWRGKVNLPETLVPIPWQVAENSLIIHCG
jgi:hypothetical protein